MSFCHVQRKLIAIQPRLQFLDIAINSLIQLSPIARLMFRFEPVQEELLRQRGAFPTQKTKIAIFSGVFYLTLFFI